jgi:hypothetical protein
VIATLGQQHPRTAEAASAGGKSASSKDANARPARREPHRDGQGTAARSGHRP